MYAIRLPALALCAALSGCAAMFDGTKAEVHFTSRPSGATVKAGKARGITPCTLELAKSTTSATFVRPPSSAAEAGVAPPGGDAERHVPIEREFRAGWLLMDVLFTPGFGLVGAVVDGTTSSWYRLPAFVHCDLDATGGTE